MSFCRNELPGDSIGGTLVGGRWGWGELIIFLFFLYESLYILHPVLSLFQLTCMS
jgi:hypothetical protein